MIEQTVRTIRLPLHDHGPELRISLWEGALVMTKVWPEEADTPVHRDSGQVAVPSELLPDLRAALEELEGDAS